MHFLTLLLQQYVEILYDTKTVHRSQKRKEKVDY